MPARRVPLLLLIVLFSTALFAQTNTPAGAGTYPAQPEPNSFANLGVRPEVLPWDQGEAGLHLLAKKLKNTGRIMHLTAHPDDEDGALLTYLARGQGRQVLLMSLTRGEGGQNRTGSNLWDELGVLRTLELLESTRYYGTELRFSRVADFGFSKSADETFQKWGGHQVPLRDIVYVIREWKPDVLFTRFSGTPRDGHGMHQASAILAPEAVKCAADPNCFPDQLKGDHALTTWQVLKLYMGNQGGDYTVRYDVSQIDPDTKLSYTQMALEGFKHQASQLSGNFTPPSGPNWRSYKLISTTIPNYKADKEQDFFDGIDTSLKGLRNTYKLNKETLAQIEKAIESVEKTRNLEEMTQVVYSLTNAYRNAYPFYCVDCDRSASGRLGASFQQAADAMALLAGLKVEVNASEALITPDHKTPVNIAIENADSQRIAADAFFMPAKQQLTDKDFRNVEPHSTISIVKTLEASADLPFTRQHWVRDDPEKDTVYRFTNSRFATHPFPPDPFAVEVVYRLNSKQLTKQGIRVTTAGPKRMPLAFVPQLSVALGSTSRAITTAAQSFEVAVKVHAVGPTGDVTVRLAVPTAWQVSPAEQKVQMGQVGQDSEARFTVKTAELKPGRYELRAEVESAGKKFTQGFTRITRDDLDTAYYFQPAIQRVSIVDVNVPKNLRVGYIPGAGDDIFPVLQQLGLNAKLISNDELAKGDLHQYDTIVVGIRGYDERPEIRANNQRLLDFVKDGGTLLVQNQKAEDVFNGGKFTPYPATLGRQRVSVEEAPVTVLAPNDPIFNAPNKITQADFDGWVQERGINFMSDWDSKFEPLLASNDPGEQPLQGGLLRAKYGKGTYIYTGYAFFRQLPAGVPGAVRLYVNLLNAGHEAK